jgi:hypothetical protein
MDVSLGGGYLVDECLIRQSPRRLARLSVPDRDWVGLRVDPCCGLRFLFV